MYRQMLKRFCLILAVFFGGLALADERPELQAEKVTFDKGNTELSGLILTGGHWLGVSDKDTDHYVYELVFGGKASFIHKPFIDFEKLKGYKEYRQESEHHLVHDMKHYQLDLEGITACDQTLYIIDERVRQVVRIDSGTFTKMPIDFSGHPRVFEGEANAGFEGIAVDCAGHRMFLGKERDPRFILTVDMNTWKVTGESDLGLSNRQGQKVINFKTGNGLMSVREDLSDLFFTEGYLYVLERDTYEIAKVDPKTMAVVSRVSFFFTLKDMFSTGEPFGIAEDLVITKDQIIVGTDNNESPVSVYTEQTYRIHGSHTAVMFFKRPTGF